MLKLLVRLTALGVSVFLAVLTGIFISAGEDGFPWGTDHTAKLVFSDSPLTKDQAIADLNGIVDSSDLRLAKLVADPDDFLTSKSLYVFGDGAPKEPMDLAWFRPEMSGQLRAASTLGDAPLDGTYVYSGSEDARAKLLEWASQAGVQSAEQVKTTPAVLAYAFLNTGALLPLLTSVVLLISITLSWYVLRARARTLKVLSGTRSSRILAEDLSSLLRVTAPSAVVGLVGALVVLIFMGKSSFLVQFVSVMLTFLAFALALMLLGAALVSAITWPSVAGIASRRPAERHFRFISEVLKFATLAVVAVLLPAAGSAIASATLLSDQGARWEALTGQVTMRIGTNSPEEFDAQVQSMDDMVQAAAERGSMTFSYSSNAARDETLSSAGFDGMVMVNPAYLKAIGPLIGVTPTADRPLGSQGVPVGSDDLPDSLSESLASSFELWNRNGRNLDGMTENFKTYRYTGSTTFPGLPPVAGEMQNLSHPLVVVIASPATTFTPDFLASTISSGNVMFSDADWVREYLTTSPLRDSVLAVDRVSDGGLYSSQQSKQTADVRTLSYILVVLALVVGVSVSAWIYALTRGRRLFVQRTSGWTWSRVLMRRMVWESMVAIVVTAAVLAASNIPERPDAWWIVAAIPIYFVVSALLHLAAVKSVFRRRLVRTE